jgi:V-type H+-transporting ATPase subunit A
VILQEETNLQEIVQLVGKDSLSEDQKLALEVAKIIREDFLQQNAFTDFDYFGPFAKTVGMPKIICTFYDECHAAINSSGSENKLTWALLQTSCAKCITDITAAKSFNPKLPDEELMKKYEAICDDIRAEVGKLKE